MPLPTIQQLNNVEIDSRTIEQVVNSESLSIVNRAGVELTTLKGFNVLMSEVLQSSGYEIPVMYSAGLQITKANQTVEYDNIIYAPFKESIPFTTSGVFELEKFYVIQGLTRNDITRTLANPGALSKNMIDKASEMHSITQYGSIPMAVASENSLYIPDGEYPLNTALFNQFGTDLFGPGAIMTPVDDTNLAKGRYRNIFQSTDRNQHIFGEEYLFALHRYFKDQDIIGTPPLGIFCGDSTVHGDSITDSIYLPQNAFKKALRDKGFDVTIMNKAVSGSIIGQYPLTSEEIASAVFFVFSFGINSTTGIADFVNNYRAQLQNIRLERSYLEATIIIKISNAVSDTVNSFGGGRDETQAYEQRQALRQIAREYQCFFFDTVGFITDTRSGSVGTWDDSVNPSVALTPGWMDCPFRTDPVYRDPLAFNNAIHPLNIANAWIWGRLADAITPSGTKFWATNHFINHRDVTLLSSDKASSFERGIQIQRAQSANSFPIDGTVITTVGADGTAMQMLFGYGANSQIAVRQERLSAGGDWLEWIYITPRKGSLGLENTWVVYDVGSTVGYSINGNIVTLHGNIKLGIVSSGAIITILPVGVRPSQVKRLLAVCGPSADQYASLQVRSDGAVLIQSCPSNALLSLDSITFEID